LANTKVIWSDLYELKKINCSKGRCSLATTVVTYCSSWNKRSL